MQLISKALLSLVIILSSVQFAHAKSINLYDKPATDAKVVGTIDPAKGLTVIFTPKNSQYIKVADPSNGNVGWILQADIKNGDQVTFTHSVIQNGNGNHSYQVYEYGSPSKNHDMQVQFQQLSPAQREALERFHQQTQQIQEMMNKTMSDLMGIFYRLGQPYQTRPGQETNPTTNTTKPSPQSPHAKSIPAQTNTPAQSQGSTPIQTKIRPMPPGTSDITP